MRGHGLGLFGMLALIAVVAAGCGSDSASSTATSTAVSTDTSTATSEASPSLSGTATVFAAASLTEAFTKLGDDFMAANPESTLTFSFASSSDLAGQITEGAPADVYASADTANMTKVIDGGAATAEPIVFATNRAEIMVAPGNPLGVEGVTDLATKDLVLVICAPEVPCGKYAQTIFDNAGIVVTPDSLEDNVKAVVTKVTLGEADAGIVYATDVQAAGDAASGVEIPDDINVVAEYPIVAVSDNPVSQAFIDFVTSPAGRQILASFGFGTA